MFLPHEVQPHCYKSTAVLMVVAAATVPGDDHVQGRTMHNQGHMVHLAC